MRATIKDVAKLAGVSTATVSNVLTGRKNVSESLRRRVNEASAELDYKPNSIARSLKTNQSHTIGVIVPDILNPFFAEVLKHIGDEASRKDYQVVMYESGESARQEKKLLQQLMESGVDGVIDITSRLDREELKAGFSVPLVLGDRVAFDSVDNVAFAHTDNHASGRIAADHLIERGYRKFACIAGPVDATSVARRRLEGFREGLQEHGFTEQDLLVFLCKFSFDDGYRMMNHFLDIYNQEENCAVFASSDIMAWGAVEACKSRGILIPEQIAIIGNDNIWCSKYIEQGLTTVEYPAKELGIRTMGMLLEALNHGGVFQEREVILQPSLCLRNTT